MILPAITTVAERERCSEQLRNIGCTSSPAHHNRTQEAYPSATGMWSLRTYRIGLESYDAIDELTQRVSQAEAASSGGEDAAEVVLTTCHWSKRAA